MKRTFALLSVTAALLVVAGCAKSEPSSGTAATTPPARAESEVIQAAATIEEPAQQSASIGGPAPAWENLVGTDDKQHSLKDLADAKAVAVVFTCNTCPVVQDYEDRLVQLADDYKDKGVELVAINVNNLEDDKLPAMKERAEEKGFTFAYLYDPSQQIARAYGATCTPHAFLLDQGRKVVYMGAIDDSQQGPTADTNHYLRDAIDAVLAGQSPAVATTQQFGCSIKYE